MINGIISKLELQNAYNIIKAASATTLQAAAESQGVKVKRDKINVILVDRPNNDFGWELMLRQEVVDFAKLVDRKICV